MEIKDLNAVEYKYDRTTKTLTIPGAGEKTSVSWDDLKFKAEKLVIKGEVKSIGDDVFRGFSFYSVELSSSIQSIGDNAFCGCYRLRSIKIPASVTSMGTSVFYGCDDLKEIESESQRYPAEEGVLFKVADDGERILVRYPSNRKGKHYTIPNDVVEIEEYAFAKSRNLVSITIPKTVKRIGSCAFDTCWNLRFITASWSRPPKVNSDIFCFFTKPSKIRLIVPYGMRSTYRAAPVWKKCMVVEWSYPERSASYRLRLLRNVRSKISYSHVACRHKKRIVL
jgi:fibronectin type III domain